MRLLKLAIVFAAICLVMPPVAHATPVFELQAPLGVNLYQIYQYEMSDSKLWGDPTQTTTVGADAFAQSLTVNGVSGHLATITSLAEDTFIDNLRLASATNKGGFVDSELWVGGYQIPGSMEPDQGWTWVNGEGGIAPTNAGPGYANWLANEPNDLSGEEFLAVGLNGNAGWNDEGSFSGIYGLIVEFDNAVPEPSSLALATLCGLSVMGCARRRRKKLS